MDTLNTIQIIHATDADQHLGHLKKILDQLKSERRIENFTSLESDSVNENSFTGLRNGDMVITLLTSGIEPVKAAIEEVMLNTKTRLPGAKMAEIIIDHVPYENQFIAFPSDLQPIRAREDMDGVWSKIGNTLKEIFPVQEEPAPPVTPVPWKKYLPYIIGALVLLLLFLLIPAPDDKMEVVSVKTSVSAVESDTDDCPKQFDFQGVIKVNAKGKVEYQWIRSDGQEGPIETLEFEDAGEMEVSSSWVLGSELKKYEEWQQLKIVSPNSLISNQEAITFECEDEGPSPDGPIDPVIPELTEITVTAQVTGDDKVSVTCGKRHRFNFNGVIKTDGKGSVDYVWEDNDGTTSEIKTLIFQKGGSKTVTTTKTLRASSQTGKEGWLALKVVSPKTTSSDKTAFVLLCENDTQVTGIQSIGAQIKIIGSSNITTACPRKLKFVGQIRTDGAGAVRYTWERKNGTTSGTKTLNFTQAGTKDIVHYQTISSSTINDWVRVKVISPKTVYSAAEKFTVNCSSPVTSEVEVSFSNMGGTGNFPSGHFANKGIRKITAAVGGQGSYCSDAQMVSLGQQGATYLSTARPGRLSECNTVPLSFVFNKAMKTVKIEFMGSNSPYTLTAYRSNGSVIATKRLNGNMTSKRTISYTSSSANIQRVVFGRQASITKIYRITADR